MLSRAVNSGLFEIKKKQGSKIKIYQPLLSFTDLLLGSFNQLDVHISEVKPQLSKFTKKVNKIPNSMNDKAPFLTTLRSFEEAYSFTSDFSRFMKRKLVTELKEKIDSGHPFI